MQFRSMRRLVAGAAIMMTSIAAAPAQGPGMQALAGLEMGQWELRVREPGGEVSKLCLHDLRQLLQPRHQGATCKRFVVTDTAQQAVVTLDCAAAGSGRTALRVETSKLVQIQSQGISGGAPFSYDIEARKVGECG